MSQTAPLEQVYGETVEDLSLIHISYNVIQAPKQILVSEETAHYAYPEQWAAAWKWVADFFQDVYKRQEQSICSPC